ncbi:golgin subfamily A member 6-like protein 6 isoform X5 [Astatotilapia calliptera]|uniref:golgin subfamily A member 6-like protein 6 isoform X5 n=1 Tax=Astatotilapia calliptera TaxID=8154 RepID=UPI000E418424|nr:golgin subfamily A member 6-like protein 6 isoform X5 [Astatotilapia calliptera]
MDDEFEGKCTFQLFANRQYDCQKERKKKEFEGTSSQMVIFSKSDRTGVEESEAREWVPKSVSSSEDDGTDDWKPTQDESEGYSEEEEEQERKRIPKVAMKNKTGCPMPQREMVAASEEDGTHDSRPTQDESKDDSKDEAEHLGQMIHKVAMEKMQQAYVSQDKAMTVNKSSEKRVIHQTRCLKRLTFHQSTLFEDTIPRSDNNKKDQSGMSSAAIITSEQLEEKEIQEESLEKMKSEDKEGKRKEKVQQEPLEKMSGKRQRKEEKIQAEPLEKMSGKRQRKEEKIQAEPLEKMSGKRQRKEEKIQAEPLEKMKSEAKVGKRKEKVQQEPLEKMSEGGKDSENKVQFIPLLPVSPRNALFEGFCIVFVFEDSTFFIT